LSTTKRIIGLFALLLAASNACALESFSGKVTSIEVTYMPDTIRFVMDTGNATCPAGRPLTWSKNPENNKAVYAALLSALTSGKSVLLYINDGDTGCNGQFVYVSN